MSQSVFPDKIRPRPLLHALTVLRSDIVTLIIPGVLQYLIQGYDINITDYHVSCLLDLSMDLAYIIKVQDVSDCPKISYQPYRSLS